MPNPSFKVLLAHTDQAFREKVRYGLEYEGYQVLEAADGEQGLELAAQNKPHLMLLDLVLPRLSGIKMVERLRHEQLWAREIPVVAVIDSRTREEDIDGIVAVCPDCQFIKSDWALGHIVAKARELLQQKNPNVKAQA